MSVRSSLGRDASNRDDALRRDSAVEAVAGLMASAALFTSVIALVYRPMRIAPAAVLIALVAAVMGGRHARLAGAAVAIGTICWTVGMAIAVLWEKPLF